MDRGERAITVLGLVATFCLPWPGADKTTASEQGGQPPVVACSGSWLAAQVAAVDSAAIAAQPAR